MAEPSPDDEVKHEIEMGAEEFLGHALPGNPEERIAVLETRVQYLNNRLTNLCRRVREGELTAAVAADTERSLMQDLRRACKLLADFQAQRDGRN